MRALTLLATLPLSLSAATGGEGDRVHLVDGRTLEGRVVHRDAERVLLRGERGIVELDAEEVRDVDALEDRLAALLELQGAVGDDLRGLVDLAAAADARGLPAEADLLRLRALAREPELAAAHEGLEHRRRGEVAARPWLALHDGTWTSWTERTREAFDWGSAWELESSHYQLRANVGLEVAVDVLLDLERFYLFFHDLLGGELGLLHRDALLDVHLHGDEGSFPPVGHDRTAYYDPGPGRVVLGGWGLDTRALLVHEGTHQILGRARDPRHDPDLPAWLSEGLAELFASAAHGPPGQARFDLERACGEHARRHAGAPEPIELSRLLVLASGEFLASDAADLAYAQAATLAHLCLTGDPPRRAGFLRFVRAALDGRSSAALFRELVAPEADFAERWHAHARRRARGGR